jgi:hypothetical protein
MAQAASIVAIFIAGMAAPVALARLQSDSVSAQLGRDGRKTLRVGERH